MASNPTISATKFLELTPAKEGTLPKPYLFEKSLCDPTWKKATLGMYQVNEMKRFIAVNKFNMVPTEGVLIPKELNYNPAMRNRKDDKGVKIPMKDTLATTSVQSAVFRKTDTSVGTGVANAIYGALPDVGQTFTKASIAEAAGEKFGVSGGTALTFERFVKYFPKLGVNGLTPPSTEEVLKGFRSMGMDPSFMTMGAEKSLLRVSSKVVPGPGEAKLYVAVNPKANMGYPTQAKMDCPEAVDVVFEIVERLMEIEDRVSAEPVEAYRRSDMRALFAKFDKEYPYAFLIQGKMKADVYTGTKVHNREARFYGVYPASVKFLIMQSMQALERDKLTIRSNTEEDYKNGTNVATFSGMDIGPTGVRELVECIESQLRYRDFGYLHMGDDSWIAMNVWGKYLVRFALDCSAFDLTQSREVTAPVDERMRELLAVYSPFSAELYAYMVNNKRVTLGGTVVVKMIDGKISGTPGQSITNGVIMAATIERIAERLQEEMEEYTIGFRLSRSEEQERAFIESRTADIVESVGRSLGLKIKLEQFAIFKDQTFRESLRVPDKFVGYYVYSETLGGVEAIRACADLGRSLPDLPHPQQKWFDTTEIAMAVNSVRVCATLMAMGDPLPDMQDAIIVGQWESLGYLLDTITKVNKGLVEDPYVTSTSLDEEMAVMAEGELGIGQLNYEKSLMGLYGAMHAVIAKNELLRECRRTDTVFVRPTRVASLEEEVGDMPHLPLMEMIRPKRVRKSIQLYPLSAARRSATDAHVGRRPPTKPIRVLRKDAPQLMHQQSGVRRTGVEDKFTYEYPVSDGDESDGDQDGDRWADDSDDDSQFGEKEDERRYRQQMMEEADEALTGKMGSHLDDDNFGAARVI